MKCKKCGRKKTKFEQEVDEIHDERFEECETTANDLIDWLVENTESVEEASLVLAMTQLKVSSLVLRNDIVDFVYESDEE